MLSCTVLLNLLTLAFSCIGLLSSMTFIFIVISSHRFRRNLSLILAMNLSIGGLITCSAMLNQTIYMLLNAPEDYLCPYRSYFMTVGGLYIFQTTLLQSFHRLRVTVFVHDRRLRYQSRQLFSVLSLISFTICFIGLLPLLLKKRFPYYPDAHACYIAFNDVVGVLYPSICFYFTPLILQITISSWILWHISHKTLAGQPFYKTKRRILKERRVLFRLSIPVLLLMSVGVIYFVFFFRTIIPGQQWQAPAYALHLSFSGTSLATALSMLANLLFYHQVSDVVRNLFRCCVQNKSKHRRIIIVI
ncbi:unnamed protein product [Adineta ricciae]|uniref:G-protein coupled receptors family 1 profile domain-containing protein n=1 Tax=Adineta ricciae TaxID=249248 RepID=A0A814JNW5_ADIRI|nr:unnamed protein product [Adineta ricciae]CAF1621405.1 unnamed protein product [Adineta ricciae]